MLKELPPSLKLELDKSLDKYHNCLFSIKKEKVLFKDKIILHRNECSEKLHDHIRDNVINYTVSVNGTNLDVISFLIDSFKYIAGKDLKIEYKFYKIYGEYLNF